MLYGYARVSTDDQENSVSNQVRRIKQHAKDAGEPLEELFVDRDVSGGKPLRDRAEGRKLWDRVSPGDTIVFCKVDRCFRSMADAASTLERWKNTGISVVILDLGIDVTTAAGELFFNSLASFAAFERRIIGQRVKETIAHLQRERRPYGSCRPLGWQRTGQGKAASYKPLEPERGLSERVAAMKAEGLPLTEVAAVLRAEGITKPGKAGARRRGCYRGVFYSDRDLRQLLLARLAGWPIKSPRRLGELQVEGFGSIGTKQDRLLGAF